MQLSLPPLQASTFSALAQPRRDRMTGGGNNGGGVNGVGGGRGGGACAVCKHQRRKCEPNCELASYFPAHRMNDFRALHLVFGVANLTKLIVRANPTDAARRRAAETLTWEARWRERDPADGCYREVACLRRDNALLRADNAALRRQIAELQQQQQLLLCWSAASAAGGNGGGVGGAILANNNGTPPPYCGGGNNNSGGMLTTAAARAHYELPAMHTATLAYRGTPVCTMTTANGGGGGRRLLASDAATTVAVRGGGGGCQVDANSRDNKNNAR